LPDRVGRPSLRLPPQPWIERVAQTVPEKVVRLDPLGEGFHLVGIEMNGSSNATSGASGRPSNDGYATAQCVSIGRSLHRASLPTVLEKYKRPSPA
jgi:hypothetical protein